MYFPHYKNGIKYAFTLQCPNQDKQLTLSLLHDATVPGGIHYYDVCKVVDAVTIAYNNDPGYFEFDPVTQTVLEEPPVRPIKTGYSSTAHDWELIKPFLDHYRLSPTWIDCHFTWGWFDEETGSWTGAVGKVRSHIFSIVIVAVLG